MHKRTLAAIVAALTLSPLTTGHLTAAEPSQESLAGLKMVKEFEKEGRKVLRYEHGTNYFYVVPAQGVANPPLRVVLHHAGGSGDKVLEEAFAEKHGEQYGTTDYTMLYLDCLNDKKKNWWWGWKDILRQMSRLKTTLHPTERRVLDTVEWVTATYNIDRNRVYLSGRSMGGSGSLGIGYCQGDIFAAIRVNVPAGGGHACYRLKFLEYSDPPPTINVSYHTDTWAKGQDKLLAYCKENKLPMIFAWGPFAHKDPPSMANSAVHEFPWLEIVRNEAYPVFTDADTDNTYPGYKNTEGKDQTGQLNAYFRWKNITDSATDFTMELRLVDGKKLGKPAPIPDQSTADVTLRRLQKFTVKQEQRYAWKFVRDGKVLQSGEVQPGDGGLLTIPRLKIEGDPAQLQLTAP